MGPRPRTAVIARIRREEKHVATATVAIVTGGARGIGAAIADGLAAAGHRIATFDLLAPEAAGAARFHRIVDVSSAREVEAATAAVLDRFGRIDVLVNNAGIIDVHAVDDTPEEVWDRVMAVNVKSVYLVSRAVIPHLRAVGGGSIVNVASVHALATMPRVAAYAASKGAVLALTRQMALDYYGDGIRVNALVVGSVDTDLSTAHGAGMARDGVVQAVHTGAIGRMAAPAEIAGAAVFLSSEQASFVTGAPLIVDGGMLARLD
jgi:NAD(P)-dependent dehydrogenase (short-subunit alcohol dehydrogenase family)